MNQTRWQFGGQYFEIFVPLILRVICNGGFHFSSSKHEYFIKQKTEQPHRQRRRYPRRPGLYAQPTVQKPHTRRIQSHADKNSQYIFQPQNVPAALVRMSENPPAMQPKCRNCSGRPACDGCRHRRNAGISQHHVKSREIRKSRDYRSGAIPGQ